MHKSAMGKSSLYQITIDLHISRLALASNASGDGVDVCIRAVNDTCQLPVAGMGEQS